MNYQGDIRLGDTIDIGFTTVDNAGAPTSLLGTPSVAAYVGNSTTEITAGITLSVDFDSRTGYNNVRVVATSGNGYATATNIRLVITAGTVNGQSVVGYEVGSFSIEDRSALMPTTAARTIVVDASGRVDLSAWLGSTVNALISGRVDANAQVVGDKTGYALTQTFPTNFSALSIDVSGRVDLSKWLGNAVNALISGRVDANTQVIATGAISSTSFSSSAIDAAALATDAVNEIRDAIFARTFSAAYSSLTFDQICKVMVAVLAAKLSGAATTTVTIRNLADNADVVVATVDSSGNRTAVVITP